MRETVHPVRTFWKIGGVGCVLYTGDSTFELRLMDGDQVIRFEPCRDSGDAYLKSQHWMRSPLLPKRAWSG